MIISLDSKNEHKLTLNSNNRFRENTMKWIKTINAISFFSLSFVGTFPTDQPIANRLLEVRNYKKSDFLDEYLNEINFHEL